MPFNPLTQVTAVHAVWADDPSWSNPGDGNAVSSWRNQSGGGNPAAAGGVRPTFDAVNPAYGGRATVHFTSASSQVLNFDIANVTQPYKLVVVGNHGAAGVGERVAGTGNALANGIGHGAGNVWTLQAGTSVTGSASDLNPHVFRATVNGASSQLWVDEVSVASGSAGTNAMTMFTIGAGSTNTPAFSNYLNGDVAFYGVYAGATSDADLSTLVADLRVHHGFITPGRPYRRRGPSGPAVARSAVI